ncbi:MAG: hypothetical protein LC793_00400, partial [Thermomicrobia bacterium]|nr:hypothetical protein [Thermomicrobia bacterium]
ARVRHATGTRGIGWMLRLEKSSLSATCTNMLPVRSFSTRKCANRITLRRQQGVIRSSLQRVVYAPGCVNSMLVAGFSLPFLVVPG